MYWIENPCGSKAIEIILLNRLLCISFDKKSYCNISYNYAIASKQIKSLNSQNMITSKIIKFCHDYDNIKKNYLKTDSKILK